MSESFAGKTVIVTGAGRGIGRAIAQAFADAGANVVMGARTMIYAEEAAAAIRSRRGNVRLYQLDVKDRAGVEGLVATAVQTYGGVDVIVHAAADIPHGGLDDISEEAIDAGFASSSKCGLWLIRAARPYLRQARDGGRVIFISSIVGPRTVLQGRLFYGVAKAGLEAFVRGAALELARENITVNGVEPGLIASARATDALGEAGLASVGSMIPVPRAGKVEEIAHAVMFLASRASAYITGTNMVIDGGSILSTSQVSPRQLADHDRND